LPSLRVSFDNGSGVDLPRTHFRLVFWRGDLPLSRSDENRTIKAAEKRDFVFLTMPLDSARAARPAPGTRLRYALDVFPSSKDSLPTIRGEMVLEQP